MAEARLSSRIGWLLCLGLLLGWAAPALAQGAHHPFAVGADEGGIGRVSGLTAWIMAQESGFYRLLTRALRGVKESGWGIFALAGLSFAYGVFHAAGPGHGKAVVASYMLSNERALRRGLVIALAAALVQGLVAVGLVAIAALIFKATAAHMTEVADILETASYAGIVLLGAALVWSKGRALQAAFRMLPAPAPQTFVVPKLAYSDPGRTDRGFFADDCTQDHRHGLACGHFHVPDPRGLDEGFAWKNAAVTVLTAGARPCSGAILILVFALAQGVFLVGVGATFAMSLGTAMTTGALASLAVLAKTWAVRFSGPGSLRALVIGRLIEVGAACAVLLLGLVLLSASLAGMHQSL